MLSSELSVSAHLTQLPPLVSCHWVFANVLVSTLGTLTPVFSMKTHVPGFWFPGLPNRFGHKQVVEQSRREEEEELAWGEAEPE